MDTNLAYALEEKSLDELMDGELVAMSPRPATAHNIVAGNVNFLLGSFFRNRRCTPFADGEDLFLTDRDRFVPNGMVVCDPEKIRWNGVYGPPDLVIEVLSPSTRKRDRTYKKDAYEKSGVREYWILSPMERSVEQYLLEDGKLVLHDVISGYPDYMLEAMTEEEKSRLRTSFSCGIFPDLTVRLEDVFWRLDTLR